MSVSRSTNILKIEYQNYKLRHCLAYWNSGDEDMFDVISALTPLASKWRLVGIGLGLNSSRVDNIQDLCHGKPKESIGEVVSDFLKKRYNTEKFGEPSWQSVVKVVAHPAAGDDKELAKKIARDHPPRG